MAENQYSLNLQAKSRGKGKSAADSISYVTRSKIIDITTGLVCDNREKKDLKWERIYLPSGANPEWSDAQKLCDAIELYSNSSNARILKIFRGSVPNELSEKSKIAILDEFSQHLQQQGLCVASGYHSPPPNKKGQSNDHNHIAITTRPCKNGEFVAGSQTVYKCKQNGEEVWLTAKQFNHYKGSDEAPEKIYKYYPKGSDKKDKSQYLYLTPSEFEKQYSEAYERVNKTPVQRKQEFNDWNTVEWLNSERSYYAELCNKYLGLEGFKYRWSEKSYKEQGIEKKPTKHLGTNASDMEMKNPGSTELGRKNTKIMEQNEAIDEINRLLDNNIINDPIDIAQAKEIKQELLEDDEATVERFEFFNLQVFDNIIKKLEEIKAQFCCYVLNNSGFLMCLSKHLPVVQKVLNKLTPQKQSDNEIESLISTATKRSSEQQKQNTEKTPPATNKDNWMHDLEQEP